MEKSEQDITCEKLAEAKEKLMKAEKAYLTRPTSRRITKMIKLAFEYGTIKNEYKLQNDEVESEE